MEAIFDTTLAVVGWVAFVLAILVGLVLDLLGLFGNWIIFAAIALAWLLTGFEHFGILCLLILLGLAVLGEVFETASASYGAARFGGSKGTMVSTLVGAIAGAILGSPWFPVVGTLLGALLGAFIGAALYEFVVNERHAKGAAWTGFGAALGKVAGVFAKLAVGFVMLLVALAMY
jgi:uncharacterized protein